MVALFLCIVLVSVSFAFFIEYGNHSHLHSDSQANPPPTVDLVRLNAGKVASAAMSTANFLNLSFNYSRTVDNIMDRYYQLENSSSFDGFMENYSNSVVVSCEYSINTSSLSPLDPLGLNSDLVYIEFLDIYTYYHNSTGQPTQVGSIIYSINAGTGIIAGPTLSVQYLEYAQTYP